MASTSTTMSALFLDAPQQPFRNIEMPRPVPAAGQVLVRIHASGVNPLDTKIRAGRADHARQALPAVLGMDLAGVVEQVGPGVTRFAPGDEVFGLAGGIGGLQGTLAQYSAVDADLLAHKPRKLTMREAAGMPLAFITAYEGLVDRAHTHDGQRVLVHGGAGGVGHMAVQLARSLGADVYATVSPRNADIVRGYGATPIDYTAVQVEDYVQQYTGGEGFDVVYDTVGGATLDASFAAARTYGGHVVSALGWGTHALAPLSFRAATYSGVFTLLPMLTGKGRKHHGEILEHAAQLADAGLLRPIMDERRFDFDSIEAAHEIVASGKAAGRIVVEVA